LVGIKLVRNYVLNNFKLCSQLSNIHSFHSKSLWNWQNSVISKKESFVGLRKRCIFRGWLWYSKLFKIPFMTTFTSTKTLYNLIYNICDICQIFEFFEYGKFWPLLGENDVSWKVNHGEQSCLKYHSWQISFRHNTL